MRFKTCSVEGCSGNADRSAEGRTGLCSAHYRRKGRHGDPQGGGTSIGAAIGWLYEKVSHSGDDCLIWPFSGDGRGYGQVWLNDVHTHAHRAMCILAHGAPPSERSMATHSCGNGHLGCVNPRHLRWGTHQSNMNDMKAHGRAPVGERNGTSKLTDEDIRAIREMAGSAKQKEIAKAFGIEQPHVSQILSGRIWKHVV